MTKRINLNTDFLDEDDAILSKDKWKSNNTNEAYKSSSEGDNFNQKSSNKDTKKTYGFWHVFWGLVILVVVIALFGWFDDKPKPTSTSTPPNYKIDFSTKDTKKTTTTTASNTASNSNEDEVITWQFSCSTYNHNEAGRLSPSTVKKSELDTKEAELNSMDSWIDKIEAEIDSFKLNESSQSSVNTYNKKIETYNSLVNKRKTKYTEYKKLLDSYNASVDKYNSFLEKNCTRRY